MNAVLNCDVSKCRVRKLVGEEDRVVRVEGLDVWQVQNDQKTTLGDATADIRFHDH